MATHTRDGPEGAPAELIPETVLLRQLLTWAGAAATQLRQILFNLLSNASKSWKANGMANPTPLGQSSYAGLLSSP